MIRSLARTNIVSILPDFLSTMNHLIKKTVFTLVISGRSISYLGYIAGLPLMFKAVIIAFS